MSGRTILIGVVRAGLTLWLAYTIVFLLLRVIPGNALRTQLIESGASETIIAEREAAAGVDKPLAIQYGVQFLGMLRGDLGISLLSGRPVAEIIGEQVVPSLSLAAAGMVIGASLGILLGIGATVDKAVFRSLSQFLIAILLGLPVFLIAIGLLFIFSVWLQVLPASGGRSAAQLILPASTLGLALAGSTASLLAATIRETQQRDYVRTAISKGLPNRSIWQRHVLKPSAAPLVVHLALQAGFVMGGTVLIEVMFSRPGVGRIAYDAVLRQDYTVVQGVVMYSALIVITMSLIGELLSQWLDPRAAIENNLL
jgi:peptide/nickel transport system permease protein